VSVTHSAVLIVDDEPLVRDTVSELLSGAGLSILEAKNGAEALEVLNKRAYAVAVFVDGYPHAGRRRWDRPRAHRVTQLAFKVILMSGYYDGADGLPAMPASLPNRGSRKR